MSKELVHPATGDRIVLEAGEELWRIDWSGKPVLVITRLDKAGELRYRLAVPKCTTWNRVGDMKLTPWPKPPDHAEAS
jgi:hypothetical protein